MGSISNNIVSYSHLILILLKLNNIRRLNWSTRFWCQQHHWIPGIPWEDTLIKHSSYQLFPGLQVKE